MTTTTIITSGVNSTADGFDLAANGDTLVVAPNVFLGSDAPFGLGVAGTDGGYVIDDGDISGPGGGIYLDSSSAADNYSEVWVASQGVVQGEASLVGSVAVDIGAGAFTIQNYGQILAVGSGSAAVATQEPERWSTTGRFQVRGMGLKTGISYRPTAIICRIMDRSLGRRPPRLAMRSPVTDRTLNPF